MSHGLTGFHGSIRRALSYGRFARPDFPGILLQWSVRTGTRCAGLDLPSLSNVHLKEFSGSFDVTTFGMPVARWTYRFAELPAGGARVTEQWTDRRVRGAWVLGRVFTGGSVNNRPEVNREGMRATLQRLKRELELELEG